MFRKITCIISFLFITMISFAKSIEFDEKSLHPDLQVHLETDRTVFNYRDPIRLRVSVLNAGDGIDISIHPEKGYFNYYVEVFSQDGISIPEKDSYFAERFNDIEALKSKQKNSTLNISKEGFKSVSLMTDKMIGDQVNLAEIFDLKPGHYLVRTKFYPKNIIEDPLSYIYSPYIQVVINPEVREQEKTLNIKQGWEKDKGLLKTPEDSVYAFFNGKVEGNWDKFFYVIDLRQLITIFANFNTAYAQGSSEDKDSVLNDFRSYLKDVNANEKILSVEIQETTIRKDQALVKVLVQIELEHRQLSREYLFKLVKQNNWIITAYTVSIR